MPEKNTLADAGPLIALFDRDDAQHGRVKKFVKAHPELRWTTTWLVLAEVCALLPRRAVAGFLEFVGRGGLTVSDLTVADLSIVLALMQKYADLPMDLADASLVVLAERLDLNAIVSLDSDFAVYRLRGKRPFKNLL